MVVTKEEVKEALQELGTVSARKLADYFGVSDQTIYNKIKQLDQSNPCCVVRVEGGGYKWKETLKNSEGYSDPTAQIAIQNVAREMMSNSITEQEPEIIGVGDVVEVESERLNGRFVIVADEYQTVAMNVYPISKSWHAGMIYAGDSMVEMRLTTISKAKFNMHKVGRFDDKAMQEVREALASFFGITPKVQVIKEDDTEIALLRQKAEIWEDAFKTMCKGGRA